MPKKARRATKKGKKLRAGKLQRRVSTLKSAVRFTRPAMKV